MKFKSVFLYVLGAFFLLFGYRDLWEKLQVDKKTAQTRMQQYALAKKNLEELQFDVQKLELDTATKKLKNPNPYFSIINVGKVNFAKQSIISPKTVIETDSAENASDSI